MVDYREKWENAHKHWQECLQIIFNHGVAAKRIEDALRDIINCKMFVWKFDHSGAMNATQLAERDRFLDLWGNAKRALNNYPGTGKPEMEDTHHV